MPGASLPDLGLSIRAPLRFGSSDWLWESFFAMILACCRLRHLSTLFFVTRDGKDGFGATPVQNRHLPPLQTILLLTIAPAPTERLQKHQGKRRLSAQQYPQRHPTCHSLWLPSYVRIRYDRDAVSRTNASTSPVSVYHCPFHSEHSACIVSGGIYHPRFWTPDQEREAAIVA